MNTMLSPLAGQWYPADSDELRAELNAFLPAITQDDDIIALIAPHAGYRFSGRVAASAYARLNPKRYKRVVILAPAHHEALTDSFSLPDADAIQTPLGVAQFDATACNTLRASPFHCASPSHREEHSHQIQVPFLQLIFGEALRLVPVLIGQIAPGKRQALAEALKTILTPGSLLVISTDFTHYGPSFGYLPFSDSVPERIAALDEAIYSALAKHDAAGLESRLEETKATICGREALLLLPLLLSENTCFEKTDYETSGSLLGNYAHSVSYLSAVVHTVPESCGTCGGSGLSTKEKKELLVWARSALESAVARNKLPEKPPHLTPGMEKKSGAFITLHTRTHALRGCIGEILPMRPLWKVIRDRTRSAALEDPRFPPVSPREVPELTIEISLLTAPAAIDTPEAIILGQHGVIFSKGHHSAVFLPQVAIEQDWSREQLLTHLARKAGLPDDAWRAPDARFEVFETDIFGE